MIIECICKKKFEIDSSLIPNEGRSIQCGSCNHIWFYVPKKNIEKNNNEAILKENQTNNLKVEIKEEKSSELKKKIKSDNLKKKRQIKISMILSYIIVLIISFAALIILLETFRLPLIVIFPRLELFLYNFFETIKDMFLFSKNLII